MYQRSIKSSGGSDHVWLVKEATKRIIDEFEECHEIVLNYEDENIHVNIKPDFDSRFGRTNVNFNFRPDITVTTTQFKHETDIDPEKRKLWQAHRVFFEAETDPRNIFKNLLKMECYRKMRRGSFFEFAFVLVCFEDEKLPKDTKPFEEIWLFPRKVESK